MSLLPAREPGERRRGMTVTDECVFVVDDDDSVRRGLSRLIRSAGWRVETFPTAKSFLEYTPPNQPGCLVLDLQLPGVSGLELQRRLVEAGRDIPIVFITGHGDVPSSVRAMKGGAVDFLQKPFDDQALLDCIARALSANRVASISTNSFRRNAGLCSCTQCTCSGCRSSAARMTVVLPVPASPSSSVTPFRLAMAYSRLLSASRCASVRTRYRGFGVRSNGRSRNPKNDSYISAPSWRYRPSTRR